MLKQFIKGLAAVGLLAIFATTAKAGLVFDMTLADGTKSVSVAAGTQVEVDLWVKIAGTDTSRNNDKFIFAWGSVAGTTVTGPVSQGIAGGAAVADPFGLGTTDMALGQNVIYQPFTAGGAQFGALQPLTGGAAVGMGSTAANVYNDYIKVGADVAGAIASSAANTRFNTNDGGEPPSNGGYPAVVTTAGAGASWKALVGKFFVTANSGIATWDWVPANFSGYQYSASVWAEDGVNKSNDGITAASIGTATIGAPVTIEAPVPEPASLSLLALGALGLLARRRA